FAGLLRASLTDGQPLSPGQVEYEYGDPRWFEHPLAQEVLAKAQQEEPASPPPPVHIVLKQVDKRRRRLDRKSPSHLEGGRRIRLKDVFGHEDMTAIQRGLVMHAWFAQIERLEEESPYSGAPDDETLLRLGNEAAKAAIHLEPLIKEVLAMLKHPDVAATLRRDDVLKTLADLVLSAKVSEAKKSKLCLVVENEHRFAVREADAVVAGIMDRVVLLYEGDSLVAADLIDFKTDVLKSK